MTWYKSGTVSVTQNSNAVIGVGTAFIANSRVGDAWIGPDSGLYEVTNIASDTALSISPPYKGQTVSGGTYALAPMQGYLKDTADALRQASLEVGGALDGLEESVQSASQSATAALASKNAAGESAASAGQSESATLDYKNSAGLSANAAAQSEAASLDYKNAAETSATNAGQSEQASLDYKDAAALSAQNAAASAASAGNLGVGSGYIDGLIPSWNSSSSITVSAGAAFIQSSNKVLRVLSPITLTGIGGLTADVFYYLYLYENAGAPAIELSAVVPAAPFSGAARSKTGDSSRRFVCALRSSASGTIYIFQVADGLIFYSTNTAAAPFRRLSGGGSNVYASVSLSTVVPPTTQTAMIRGSAASGVAGVSNSFAGNVLMTQFDSGSRYMVAFPTAADQSILYIMLSAGTFTLDVCGYGMDR